MPSLRQKVTTYFRQLSFIAEPREGARNVRKVDDEENFIIKYLEGRISRSFVPGPEIFNGQNPTDLPELKIDVYPTGPDTITAASTGPEEGLTGIKRSKLHLSASYADDIDFIDTIQEDCFEVRKSTASNRNHNRSNRSSVTRRHIGNAAVAPTNDQNANKTSGMRSRKNSRTSIANLTQDNNPKSTTATKALIRTTTQSGKADNSSNSTPTKSTTIVVSMVSRGTTAVGQKACVDVVDDQKNKNISVAATEDDDANKSNDVGVQKPEEDKTTKLLENTTERLLQQAVCSSQPTTHVGGHMMLVDAPTIASVSNWRMETEYAYGISVSLYENNMLTKEPMGNPIADCYGLVVRGNAAIMAVADGVNWGDGARLAARSAVHGCLDYLDRAIFGLVRECMATTTQEVFVSLLRSVWEGHGCILEVGGALSTLTIAVVLPLHGEEEQEQYTGKYVLCGCNVGDSLGYVYSQKHGVREFTQASHDITSMRDMRDALGALGPADGNQPELSNLTLSMTIIEQGDIVFLTSDGVSDNFDPVVGKFAEAWAPNVKLLPSQVKPTTSALAPKQQNKSSSDVYSRLHRGSASAQASANPGIRRSHKKHAANAENTPETGSSSALRPKYMRSHTVIEPRRNLRGVQQPQESKIPKSAAGLPLVTAPQRHALTLYRLEDLLSFGINGTFSPCVSARRLCHLLIDFVRMITSARRKTLEQRELFYKLVTGPDGIRREMELNRMQHRAARKRIVDSSAFIALPGKLDHATVVAYTVGGNNSTPHASTSTGGAAVAVNNAILQSKEFQETTF